MKSRRGRHYVQARAAEAESAPMSNPDSTTLARSNDLRQTLLQSFIKADTVLNLLVGRIFGIFGF